MTDLQAERDQVVRAALAHVPFDGWGRRTLRQALDDAGLAQADGDRLFPGGAVDLVDHFNDLADRMMVEAIGAVDPTLKLRGRVAEAVRLRIAPWTDDRESVRRAVALLALPQNALIGARITYRTVDALWRAVGDTSTALDFYTKRATLAGVYGATVLYWLDDPSDGAAETWGFLERRLDNVMRLPRLTAALRGPLDLIASRQQQRRRFGIHGTR